MGILSSDLVVILSTRARYKCHCTLLFSQTLPASRRARRRLEDMLQTHPYETLQFGYSRAVRKGQHVFVSGTTSIDPENGARIRHPDSAYLQTLVIFKEITKSIENLHGRKEDVARVRIFVTEREGTETVGRSRWVM